MNIQILTFSTGRSENLDYWDYYIRNTIIMDNTLHQLLAPCPQYTVSKDWDERLTESKQKIEALNLEEFDDCYLLSTLVASFRNGLDYNDSKDNEKKTKNIFLAMVRQSLKDKNGNSFFQRQLSESTDLSSDKCDIVRQLLCKKDEDGNTALHHAASKTGVELEDSITLIIQMIKDKADVTMNNNKARNFLQMLNRMPDEWFQKVARDKDVLDFFIEQKDEPDSHLQIIFKRLRKISVEKQSECPLNNDAGPIQLSEKVFHQRHLLEKSFDELIAWHGECHGYNLEEIRKCCFHSADHDKAFVIFKQTESIIKKPLKRSYYFKKAFNITFLALLFLKIVDLLLDLTVSIKYNVYYKETFIKDLPPKENCSLMFVQMRNPSSTNDLNENLSTNFPIACYFHEMDDAIFGWSSFSIFVFMYLSELYFFMGSDKTLHYRAIMSGYCCTECYQDTKWYFSPAKIITYILLPIMNQIIAFIYGFFCKTFVDYWRCPASSKIGTIDREHRNGKCKRCEEHKHNMEENSMVSNNSICVFCDTKPGDNKERILLGDGKASDDERKLLEDIENHKSNVTAISKLVTAATENSFMPLLQLTLVFPNFIALFPQPNQAMKPSNEETDKGLLGYVENLNSNWKFIVITGSITTSLFSLAKSLTLTYFSKPGKKSFQTYTRLAVLSIGIVLQVIPKIFAYQLFGFGFIAPTFGANYIVPFILIAPLIHSMVFATTLFIARSLNRNEKKCQGEKIFALK